MTDVVISGTGLYAPEDKISNDELVESFNKFVDQYNQENAADIEAGKIEAKAYSSAEFIEKASGIKNRHVIDKVGTLDINRMQSEIKDSALGDDETPCLQADWSIKAANQALKAAGKTGADVDYVVSGAALQQRYFPAISIEVQKHLGAKGYAMDLIMACSSATFALISAYDAILSGRSKCALVVNPEIFSTLVNYRDRDSHFIFGDVCTALVLEAADTCTAEDSWKIINTKAATEFSSNIRSEYGPFTRMIDDAIFRPDMFFVQQGRKVFKELLPMVTSFIEEQLGECNIGVEDLSRMWLHQANINMNMYAAKKLLGRLPEPHEAPVVLDEYANTAGAGSIVAFHLHRDDLKSGDKGLICSFGAGYSIGGLVVEKT